MPGALLGAGSQSANGCDILGLETAESGIEQGPARHHDDPAVLGAHAHEESVGPPAAAVIGLKRTLHREQSSEQGPEPNGRTTNSSEPRFYLSIAPGRMAVWSGCLSGGCGRFGG